MSTSELHKLESHKPVYRNLAHEAQLAIVRTGLCLTDDFEKALRPHGVTAAQFNVLRILRGADRPGLCRNEIRDRLVNRMPDVTRLLDRMEHAGLIDRERSSEDRRMVHTRITRDGLRLLDSVEADVAAAQDRPFVDMPEEDVARLIELLKNVRCNM
jgi:DNA-binding MarR family transcriptional regulator